MPEKEISSRNYKPGEVVTEKKTGKTKLALRFVE